MTDEKASGGGAPKLDTTSGATSPACELPADRASTSDAILRLDQVTKRFPGVLAVDDVSASVAPGEVLALLGENGAGKTTLMNVAYGLLAPDEGTIYVKGNAVDVRTPRQAIDLGIGMVHQHFMLVEPFTVTENIMLGVEPNNFGVLEEPIAREKVVTLSERYGLRVDPDAVVMNLSVGQQQRVEILRVLYRDVDILILDEPTAVLTPQEVHELFQIVRQLVAEGLAVVMITHKLEEVMEFADRIIVMRRGRVVGETTPSSCDERRLAKLMVGREVVLRVEKAPSSPGASVLNLKELNVLDDRKLPAVRNVSLDVRKGEIVGIAGVDGNGQRELVEAITGLRHPESGRIEVAGKPLKPGDPDAAIQAGVALVPEDRQRRGLVLEFDLVENIALGQQKRPPFASLGILDRATMQEIAQKRLKDYDVRAPSEHIAAANLSGGNQQKLVLARQLGRDPDLLVAAQPTRGLDVGAIEFVHRRILEERDSGKAILLVSMELEEVMSLSDRILVMFEGKIVAEFEGGAVTEEELGYHMTGGGKSTRPDYQTVPTTPSGTGD